MTASSEFRQFNSLLESLHGASPADPATPPRWFIAFSGGMDSTVLLYLVARWCRERTDAPALCALHVDHGLQRLSRDWASHCKAVCESLSVPCKVLAARVSEAGRGLEAAAREARYALLAEQLQAGDVLFTAHHMDDQVETFFLRLMRGAGVAGLSAMAPERPLGKGRLVRPLLDVARAQLEACASANGLEWVDDPSNTDDTLDRNFLRNRVLPLMGERWPGYRNTVSRAAGHMADVARHRTDALPPIVGTASVVGDPGIQLDCFMQQSPSVVADMLRTWLGGLACQPPDKSALQEFLRQLREADVETAPVLDAGAYRLQRFRDAVYLLPEPAELPQGLTLGGNDLPLDVEGVGRLALRAAEQGFRLAPGERVAVRWRSGGERCRPLGRGGATSLKQWLQEKAIPPWWRERVPLLFLGDELVAVGGLGLCENAGMASSPDTPGQRWALHWEPAIKASVD